MSQIDDFFRSRLEQMIDLRKPLAVRFQRRLPMSTNVAGYLGLEMQNPACVTAACLSRQRPSINCPTGGGDRTLA
ncbi:hypothetical protein [Castellaniella sp.]|uniref:hypothetical protein n=1 Tax=Castellaniella sp. TaxID=1955812 RepID=UPI002AFE8338|nr:hypothetical protein [Castellaniella sp.]